jgi:hypothetical protein
MRRQRTKYDSNRLLSYAYPTQEQLDHFLDAIDEHHKVDADSIGGDDPHINRSVKQWFGTDRFVQELMMMKYI